MPYEVFIIRENGTDEFVCEDFSNGAFDNSVAFRDVTDPHDDSKYHKVVMLAPGDTMNFREIKE